VTDRPSQPLLAAHGKPIIFHSEITENYLPSHAIITGEEKCSTAI
jgi:hypothetical protein